MRKRKRHHHHHHHHHHWRDRDGYAYQAGTPGPGPNHHRLYRDKARGKVLGVCAGIANYYGWRPDGLRVAAVLLTVFLFPLPIIAYVIAAIFMKEAPSGPVYQSTEEEDFWRTFTTRPKATFSELKHRFRALDQRIADLEQAVTSDEYGLRKAFRDLERGA